ncbi:MAG: NmrA family NAD(P)-binding protein, partial [Candidatus Eremiobacteraeota bacterium]|nr:NmrA family NAD(P)-binding protein [Candidatus Eremiobacteraeota bacterium]
MIVVTSPTGNIGRHVVEHLIDAGKKVRVIVRDAGRLAPQVRERVEIIEGSHGDAAVVDRAFAGADAVFWLAPPDSRRTLEEVYLDFTRPAAEAFRRHAVARVVGITAIGRGTPWEHRAGLVTASIGMDDMIMATGVAYRGIAMPSFMDNALRQAQAIKDQHMMFGPIEADKKTPSTATRDAGLFAAKLLRDEAWTGQEEIPLLGPENLSMNEMAAIVSDVVGHEIRYQHVSFDGFKGQLLGSGVSESFAQGHVDMMRAKNDGMDN